MTHKIYLIKHLDTGMGYVGITGDELEKRWYQHLHDPKGELYAALRAEGHRMSMDLLEEVHTREEALIKEQQYIHSLGTAQPAGWNRDGRPLPIEEEAKPKKWLKCTDTVQILAIYSPESFMKCPACEYEYTHLEYYEIYQCLEDSPGIHTMTTLAGTIVDLDMKDYPSPRRDGMRMYFSCESCHGGMEEGQFPPFFQLFIFQHKGVTVFKTVYYIEDKS